MKFLSLAFLWALTIPMPAAMVKPDVEKAVLAAEKAWIDATVKNDAAAMDKILADELSWTHSGGKHETKAEVVAGVKAAKMDYESMVLETTALQQYGDVVVATHNQRIKLKPKGGSFNFVTLIWVKQGGAWKLVSRQATKAPE